MIKGDLTDPQWKEFVDALYEANSDIPLPPKDRVVRIGIDIEHSDRYPAITFTVVGLRLPNAILD